MSLSLRPCFYVTLLSVILKVWYGMSLMFPREQVTPEISSVCSIVSAKDLSTVRYRYFGLLPSFSPIRMLISTVSPLPAPDLVL